MHIKGLKMVKQANRDIAKVFKKIMCPILIIHSSNDPIGSLRGVKLIEKNVSENSNINRIIFRDRNHNIFFTQRRHYIYQEIGDFFHPIHKAANKEKIAAIVPAYNESEKIASVLKVLTETPIINEVIVVDDGSTDYTANVIKSFPRVKFLKNKNNMGKAYSMQKGVENTDASILFFCDADLVGLTPSIVETIIKPVINGQYDMFIGVRNNIMQKAMPLFALNSGERALRRKLWDELPKNFKYRYRVEAGLNYIANSRPKGYSWRQFNYYQTIKERKYGIISGTLLRWWMNFDVGIAYSLVIFNNITRKIK
jgi:glycosyltransferase involved in cell wall biosynthesis